MGQITAEQSQAVMAALATNVHWAGLDFQACGLQWALDHPSEAGNRFEAFLRSGCGATLENPFRETGKITIKIPALPRPTLEQIQRSQSRRSYAQFTGIERDTSPEGSVMLELASVFSPGETELPGYEYERRLLKGRERLLGWQHLYWIFKHQRAYPALSALKGEALILFTGITIEVNGGESRVVPSLVATRKAWGYQWERLDLTKTRIELLAISGLKEIDSSIPST